MDDVPRRRDAVWHDQTQPRQSQQPDDTKPASGGRVTTTRVPTIMGFSHIHSWTMGGLLTMPTVGPLKLVPGPESGSPESFRSRFRHETESASPGFYAVTLDDYGIRCEFSATTRAGIQRYTFPKSRACTHPSRSGCTRRI